jgi:hypothetical protein
MGGSVHVERGGQGRVLGVTSGKKRSASFLLHTEADEIDRPVDPHKDCRGEAVVRARWHTCSTRHRTCADRPRQWQRRKELAPPALRYVSQRRHRRPTASPPRRSIRESVVHLDQ